MLNYEILVFGFQLYETQRVHPELPGVSLSAVIFWTQIP